MEKVTYQSNSDMERCRDDAKSFIRNAIYNDSDWIKRIVLLSADDTMHDGKYRVRQNVVLELGYFIARLGRENVVALYDTSTEVEIPSDITGVLYEPYDNPNGVWGFEVVQELKAAGFDVDANALT